MPLALAVQAMGTRFELVLPGLDERRERAAGERALEVIVEWDARLSLFRRDSLIARVNREARERPVRVDPETFGLLTACDEIWRASEGAFDAALGALMAACGFREGAPEPSADVRLGSWADVVLDRDAQSVRFTAAGAQLDLGGIAKGFALDRGADVLREAGLQDALLHGGTSTIVALGAPPGRAAWRVAVAGLSPARSFELCDRALSVSALHGRRNAQGQGHVLDPRSGRPCSERGLAVALAPSGLAADAWATVALVLEPERRLELRQRLAADGIELLGGSAPRALER